MKKQHKIIQKEHRMREKLAQQEDKNQPKFFELRQGEEFKGVNNLQKKLSRCVITYIYKERTIKNSSSVDHERRIYTNSSN